MTTPNRRFKDAIDGQLAQPEKAASAPKRLELLDLLCQGPRTVEAIAEHAALFMANASQHLQVLRAARLVDAEKKGLHVYAVPKPTVTMPGPSWRWHFGKVLFEKAWLYTSV